MSYSETKFNFILTRVQGSSMLAGDSEQTACCRVSAPCQTHLRRNNARVVFLGKPAHCPEHHQQSGHKDWMTHPTSSSKQRFTGGNHHHRCAEMQFDSDDISGFDFHPLFSLRETRETEREAHRTRFCATNFYFHGTRGTLG